MANLNLSEFTEKLFVADADHTFIWDTANAISKRVSRNSWLSAGSIATSTPLTISQTWTDAAVAFAAMKIVATDTNSAAGSDFLELYSGTATQPLRLDIQKTGQINIYGTWSNSTSYERLSLSAPTAANAIIGTNKGSGGGTARGLDLHTDGAARMTITTAGNVGIGTTAPTANLDVRGSGLVSIAARSSTGVFDGAYFAAIGQYESFFSLVTNGNASGSRNMGIGNANTGNFIIRALNDVGDTVLRTPFSISNTAPTGSFNILSSGNVGIGTTSPSEKLEVAGNAKLTGVFPYVALKPAAWASDFFFQAGLNLAVNNIGDYTFFANPAGKGFNWTQNLVSRLFIDAASGNVGIGTTSPTSKLQVTNGDVEIETVTSGIIMKAAGTANRYRITLNAGGTDFVITAL